MEGDDGKFHGFFAGFVNACGIGGWEVNSEVIHAISDSPGGPFTFSDVALPTWHHNPDIKRWIHTHTPHTPPSNTLESGEQPPPHIYIQIYTHTGAL